MDVVVCIGSSCHLKGSRDVIQILERNIALNGLKDQVNLRGSFCMGRCQGGVSVTVDGKDFPFLPRPPRSFSTVRFWGGCPYERHRIKKGEL